MFAEALIGQTVSTPESGSWKLVGILGGGFFSTVYEAVETSETPAHIVGPVAVKVLHPNASKNAGFVQEFHTEGELLAELVQSPNVITLLDGSIQGTVPVLLPQASEEIDFPVHIHLLEMADGCLDEVVVIHEEADWALRLELLRDVVAGVHQMHTREIAHRDVKSSNVLLSLQGPRARGKVADLGRSARMGQPPRFEAAAYQFGRGDLSFAPPELIFGGGSRTERAARLADLYLVGSVLCELATGQGATSLIMPDPDPALKRIHALPEEVRPQGRQTEMNRLHPRAASAAEAIRQQAPPVIANEVADLFAQLCSPNPAARDARQRRDRNLPPDDLAWLFRRVDIIRTRLRISAAATTKAQV